MSNYGILINKDITLQRRYFNEMCRLRGVKTLYQYPVIKDYTVHGEIDSKYSDNIEVFAVINDNVDHRTAHKLGWNAEQTEQVIAISVPYDLENIQVGCLFSLPPAFEGAEFRRFRVVEMSTSAVYPASITCRIVPELETTVDKAQLLDYKMNNLDLLNEE